MQRLGQHIRSSTHPKLIEDREAAEQTERWLVISWRRRRAACKRKLPAGFPASPPTNRDAQAQRTGPHPCVSIKSPARIAVVCRGRWLGRHQSHRASDIQGPPTPYPAIAIATSHETSLCATPRCSRECRRLPPAPSTAQRGRADERAC
jgi:hypothetical protein